MMRPDGRDKTGGAMTVKPGVAEVLRSMRSGRMILAYSGGLHHVFRPGASRPRLFQSLHVRLESLDIAAYVEARMHEPPSFRDAVVRDLTHRRDLHTPIAPGTPAQVSAEVVRRRYHCGRDHRLTAGAAAGEGNGGGTRRRRAGAGATQSESPTPTPAPPTPPVIP